MCVACRSGRPKKELLRIVKSQDGVLADETGKMSGRGAYICPTEECLDRALKIRALNRALECEVTEADTQMIRRVMLRRDIKR